MLEKTYQPRAVEEKHYTAWERRGAFGCGRNADADAQSYAIVIPPPNVTGSLHMGHALNNTLQDIMIRHARMTGRDVLWQPGTDHAGIATQMVVERQLEAEGLTRHDLGREEFIKRVWQWKAESGGTIIGQLRRLGASCDWSRERFTMDEGLSAAVRKVFVDLYKKDLIYRDKRLVNWDPLLHTAISDLEVEQREVHGHFWTFKYPVEGQPGRFVAVATTRPETMLGDTAVAVHPDDERYADLVGKHCILPIVDRPILIVADTHADPEKGTGAVKITPAHDFNDFEVGRRHDLEMINVLDASACMNENAPERFRGLDRYEARDAIVREMETLGLLEKTEQHVMMVPYGDRSGVVVEPWLMDQWFVDAKTLAGPAIQAVEQGRTRFVPEQWTKTYFEWMRNIQPWCVSRQIWWGHQNSGVVRTGRSHIRRGDRRRRAGGGAGALRRGHAAQAGRRRARYLVLVGALAVFHPRLAGTDAGAGTVLSDRRPGHRFRHHIFLGRPDDDDGPPFHGRRAVSYRLHPRPRP